MAGPWMMPEWRPIWLPPAMVARLRTSGTVMPRRSAARSSAFSVAALRSGPLPMTEIRAVSPVPERPHSRASRSALELSSGVRGRASGGRPSSGPAPPSTHSVVQEDEHEERKSENEPAGFQGGFVVGVTGAGRLPQPEHSCRAVKRPGYAGLSGD